MIKFDNKEENVYIIYDSCRILLILLTMIKVKGQEIFHLILLEEVVRYYLDGKCLGAKIANQPVDIWRLILFY